MKEMEKLNAIDWLEIDDSMVTTPKNWISFPSVPKPARQVTVPPAPAKKKKKHKLLHYTLNDDLIDFLANRPERMPWDD